MQVTLVWLVLTQAVPAQPDPRVRLSGVVRTADSEQAIAGVAIELSNGRTQVRVTTDEQGRYECRLAPGIVSGEIVEAPREFVKPLRAFHQPIAVKPDAAEQTLPPIELVHGRRLQGKVVDENDQPVAGAEVQASWWAVFEPWLEGGARGPKWVATRTDSNGEFVLDGIDPNFNLKGRILECEVRLSAALNDRSTEAPVDVQPAGDAPITLRIAAGQAVALEGRVVDRTGIGVPGAAIEIWWQWKTPFGFVVQTPLVFDGAVDFPAGAEGRFRTAPRLAHGESYRVVARADGFVPDHTAWTRPDEATDERFPELPLARLRSVAGRVVDRQARPVAGARVFQSGNGVQRTESATDDEGRFALDGVPEHESFIFAQRAGFRFHGQWLVGATSEVEIPLERGGEPAADEVSQAAVVPTHEKLALARRVFEPYGRRAFASVDAEMSCDALFTLVRIAPGAALEKIDAGDLPGVDRPTYDWLRCWVAKGLYRESPEEAMAIVESILDPDARFLAYIELAGLAESSQHLRKRELLEQAQLLLGQTSNASTRAAHIYCVVEGLLDLGETDRARHWLDEARSIAATLPRAGDDSRSRGYVAQALARIDLSSALELIEDLEEDQAFDAYHGKIACRIAQAQPAESQRVLGMVRDPFARGSYAIRVCYRMATADPGRARRVAGEIVNPYLRAYALGLMAKAWSGSDKRRAQDWLDEAFEELERVIEAGEDRIGGPQPGAGVVAGMLLPVAQLIDPRGVREWTWRTLSLGRSHEEFGEQDIDRWTSMFAMLVARCDPSAARRLLEPLVARVRAGGLDTLATIDERILFDAAAGVDPNWAAELLEDLTADASESDERLERIRKRLAWTLATRPELTVRDYVSMWFNHWSPEMPDNEFQGENF